VLEEIARKGLKAGLPYNSNFSNELEEDNETEES